MHPDQLVHDPDRLQPCAVTDEENPASSAVASHRDRELVGRLTVVLETMRAVTQTVEIRDPASSRLHALLELTAAAATANLGARVSYVQPTDVDRFQVDAVTPDVCVPVPGVGTGGHLHLITSNAVVTAIDRVTLEILAGHAVDLAAARAREDSLDETVAQLRLEVASAREDAEHLRLALASNRHIGVALGVVVARYKVTPERAFDLLRQVSQNANRKLRDVADDVVLTGALPARGHDAPRVGIRAGAGAVADRAGASKRDGHRYRIDLTLRRDHADLRISGELDLAAHDGLTGLLDRLDELPGRVRCDTHGVTFADSHGLTPIVAAARRRAQNGLGAFVIVSPSEAVRRIARQLGAGDLLEAE